MTVFNRVAPKIVKDKTAVSKDPMLNALLTMRPAEIESWVQDNVNDLKMAKNVLATLCKAVAILAQREFANR